MVWEGQVYHHQLPWLISFHPTSNNAAVDGFAFHYEWSTSHPNHVYDIVADGLMYVDGKEIYSAKNLKVGLFENPGNF